MSGLLIKNEVPMVNSILIRMRNVIPGDFYAWGETDIIYMGKDLDENWARCSFYRYGRGEFEIGFVIIYIILDHYRSALALTWHVSTLHNSSRKLLTSKCD